ncbi:membrane protein [Mycolicibacterium duvalii]|uniref:Membrane protein n=1 Tax=Mycolicibacterium duvalii TaxID=39688 RepID=A0A7I7K6A6_9MYCO|nr:membrane protein [Mycolicibacterium duvalii]
MAVVTAAYVAAIAVAGVWLGWGPSTGRLWLDTLIADILATLVIFGFSRAYRNSSFYDAYWSVIPPLLLFYWWSQSDVASDPLRTWLVTVLVVVWAVRLTGNWVYAFPGLHHEDWRYPMFRARAGRWEFAVDLVAIHLIPTLQVFLAMVPVYVALTTPGTGLVWLAVVAFAIGMAAVALEFVADAQMHRFVADRRPGEVMDRGLWSWSRHPNYFGEFGFWFALALFGVAASPADAWWLFAGALAMLAMFLGASIPMMESRSLERRPGYQAVVDRVSRFVPRPPAKVNA